MSFFLRWFGSGWWPAPCSVTSHDLGVGSSHNPPLEYKLPKVRRSPQAARTGFLPGVLTNCQRLCPWHPLAPAVWVILGSLLCQLSAGITLGAGRAVWWKVIRAVHLAPSGLSGPR